MQLANSKSRYGTAPQILHWLTVIFVIAGWLLGRFGDVFPKGPPRAFGLFTHMTLGECVALMLVIRLVWRIANPPPPPEPTRFGQLLVLAAKVSHYTLYTLLLVVPILGAIVQLKRHGEVPILGFWLFHSPWPIDRDIARSILHVHNFLANALLILAGIHAAAALVHHYLWRDRTLARMLPGGA